MNVKQTINHKLFLIVIAFIMTLTYVACPMTITENINSTNNKVIFAGDNVISAGGYHTVAILADGTLWAWGRNLEGQLGNGTISHHEDGITTPGIVPFQIGIAGNWAFVSAGGLHNAAIKTDGTLWAWGENDFGQLGDGTTENRTVPVRIGSDNNWASVFAGGSYTVAIKTDGTLWAWGTNDFGQLGDGTTENRTAPVQIGTSGNWKSVSVCGSYHSFDKKHTVAIKTDGTLWAWGRRWL